MDLFRLQAHARKVRRPPNCRTAFARGQRITGNDVGAEQFPSFARLDFSSSSRHGQIARAWVSELMPHTAKIVDDLTFVRTMNTDAINHDPAITFIQERQPANRAAPSMGAWVSYGAGAGVNRNLPAVRRHALSQAQSLNPDQPLFSALVGQRFFCPPNHQGVPFSAPAAIPWLYPAQSRKAWDPETRRDMLDARRQNSIACTSTNSAIRDRERAFSQ